MGFSEDVAKFSAKTQAKIEMAVRKIALDVFSEVILMTPVKDGFARGSWQVAIGNVPAGSVLIEDPTGQVTINKVQAETLGLKAGQTIYLVSNLPYIERLEFGYSTQAPGGMVRLTVQRWNSVVEQVGRELSKQ